jgi:acetylornithine deacetylase
MYFSPAKCLVALQIVTRSLAADSTLQHPLRADATVTGEDSLISFHRRLIEIDSISGNEHDVANYLEHYLTSRNFTVEKQKVGPLETSVNRSYQGSSHKTRQRYNILAYPGNVRSTRILLSSHIDTVPPYLPYELREHGQIWGRGSVDDKACVATQTKAIEALLASGEVQVGDVALLFVVGEEVGGDGMKRANDLGLTWETVIFGEPTELKLAAGHKGFMSFVVQATGKAGHSGYPWLGENANSMLMPALLALEKVALPSSEKYGNSTLNIGRMEGGVAANVIAETAKAEISIRIADGTPDQIRLKISDALRSVDDRLELHVLSEGYGPIHIDSDVEGLPLRNHSFPSLPPPPPGTEN